MKKKILSLILIPLLLVGCKNKNSNESGNYDSSIGDESVTYSERSLNIYRVKDVADKQISCRFYEGTENVPYISVSAYYKEFFNTTLVANRKNHTYSYYHFGDLKYFIGFDAEHDYFMSNYLEAFVTHPDFKSSTGKKFIQAEKFETSPMQTRVVDLKNYSIPVYEENGEAYVPLTFLSQFAGGYQLYNVAYNGKDIYIIDYSGELSNFQRTPTYYGNKYTEILGNMSEERPEDLAKYTYNELCFVFDNLRGYTSQLVMGDNKLVSLGLNGVLEAYYPELKDYLLSKNKQKYYIGYKALFAGLHDGGHTVALASFDAYNTATAGEITEPFVSLVDAQTAAVAEKGKVSGSCAVAKTMANMSEPIGTHTLPGYSGAFAYCYVDAYKTAYIGFNGFDVDYDAWDAYYKGEGDVPITTDTYAFVRSKLYQAKADGAENIVLDITTNGGGSSDAYAGLIGLFNAARAPFSSYDTFNKCQMTDHYKVDINLDGKFDEDDVAEAAEFNFNIGVLTSGYSFSCANLFPSVMKELGYKIIGEQSGGGSCAINITTTADGLMYVHSAYLCLSDQNGNNIDGGVPVDYVIEIGPVGAVPSVYDYSNFYDPAITGTYLATAYDA